jgi:hypothetical protein
VTPSLIFQAFTSISLEVALRIGLRSAAGGADVTLKTSFHLVTLIPSAFCLSSFNPNLSFNFSASISVPSLLASLSMSEIPSLSFQSVTEIFSPLTPAFCLKSN